MEEKQERTFKGKEGDQGQWKRRKKRNRRSGDTGKKDDTDGKQLVHSEWDSGKVFPLDHGKAGHRHEAGRIQLDLVRALGGLGASNTSTTHESTGGASVRDEAADGRQARLDLSIKHHRQVG